MLPLLRHLRAGASWGPVRWSDLSAMMVPVQGKVGPSYKRIAMAQCKQQEVHRPPHTPGASPGEGGYFIQMHCHGHHVNSRRYRQTSSYLRTHLPIPVGTPCQQQEAHRPPHTHVHTWLVHQEVHTPPCASRTYGLCTRRYTHTSSYTWMGTPGLSMHAQCRNLPTPISIHKPPYTPSSSNNAI